MMLRCALPERLSRDASLRNPARGFTLVEMLIVVIILGVIVTIAVPSFNSSIHTSKAKRAAETLNAFLVNAKSEAIKRNSKVYAVFTSSGGGATWCAGLTTSTTCDCTAGTCTLDGVKRVINSDGSFSGVVLASPLTSPTALWFDPVRGTTSSDTVTVQSEEGKQISVVLSGRGRIKMCSPSGSSNIGGYGTC